MLGRYSRVVVFRRVQSLGEGDLRQHFRDLHESACRICLVACITLISQARHTSTSKVERRSIVPTALTCVVSITSLQPNAEWTQLSTRFTKRCSVNCPDFLSQDPNYYCTLDSPRQRHANSPRTSSTALWASPASCIGAISMGFRSIFREFCFSQAGNAKGKGGVSHFFPVFLHVLRLT